MKYIVLLFTVFLCTTVNAQQIQILTWMDFLSDSVIEDFYDETGHTVKQYFFDSELDRNEILMNGKSVHYDLMIFDNVNAKRYAKIGAFSPIDALKYENLRFNDTRWQSACGDYGVPYAKGTMGIAHRTSISQSKIDSWHDLLSPAVEHQGHTMMLKDDIDTIAVALLALGLDPFTKTVDELKLAYNLLTAQTQSLLGYGYPITPSSDAANNLSSLSLTLLYAGDLQNLRKITGYDDWQYIVPKEGTLFFVDCFVAPADKAVSTATKAFLEYINIPEVAIKNAQDIWMSTTNNSALALATEEYIQDLEINPPQKILARSHPYIIMPTESIVIRSRIVSMLGMKG